MFDPFNKLNHRILSNREKINILLIPSNNIKLSEYDKSQISIIKEQRHKSNLKSRKIVEEIYTKFKNNNKK